MSEDGRGKHATGDSEEDSLLRDVARAPDRAPADADPTRLAHFRILGRLGAGGMGVVYRAEDEKLRRKVAVKVLPESLASDPERRRRFFREARAAAAVTHANIATVYEIDEADGHVFIAMELVQGETLRARMEAHATGLTHADALRIARDIARGLASAHESGIVHRDLKPENVMITPAGDAKILDFGLAKVLDSEPGASGTGATESQTAEGRVMGTPPYMSPEQANGDGEIDARSDVFSFGTMLYEMLSGTRPFEGTTRVAVLFGVLHRDPEALEVACPSVPSALAAVVERCLKKAKGERFASGRQLLAALGGNEAVPTDLPSRKALPPGRVSTVSGMGTALGATMAAGAPLAMPETARSDGAPRRRAGVSLWAVGGLIVIAAGALYLRRSPHSSEGASPDPSASAAAAPRCNAVATGLFDEGVETWETRSFTFADDAWTRAVTADPACAPAHLRILVNAVGYPPTPTTRVDYADAQAHRDRLTGAEAALLDALAPYFAPRFDAPAAYQNLASLASRSPDDGLTEFALGQSAQHLEKPDEARAAYERAAALRPRIGGLYARLAEVATSPEAREHYLETCTRVAPRHIYCDTARSYLLGQGTDCGALERFGEEAVRRNPGFNSQRVLLLGLGANNGSREALDEAARHVVDEGAAGDFLRQARDLRGGVAILEADYSTAEQLLRDGPRARSVDFGQRASWASDLAVLLEDTGRNQEADDLVRQTLRAAPALTQPADPTTIVDFFARAIALGALTRVEVDARLGPVPATSDASVAWSAWLGRQAALALTADEARKALATMPERPANPWDQGGPANPWEHGSGDIDYLLARVRALAGDFAGARRDIESAVKRCDVLAWAPLRPRASFLLGEVRERTGDIPGAREAYQAVVAKWGQVKPKAVLADRARARLSALPAR